MAERRRRFAAAGVAVGVLAAVAAASVAASVRLAAQNVVIVRAESQGGHPYVVWQIASGWCPNVVELAKNPAVGSDGSFFAENIIDAGVLQSGQTTWLSSSPSTSNPGSYYVHVQAYACDFSAGPEWSPVVKFDVTPPPPPPPAPPPPPPAPPTVRLQLTDADGFATLAAARVGQRVRIRFIVVPWEDFSDHGRVCIALVRGSTCRRASTAIEGIAPAIGEIPIRVLPKMVVRGRLAVSALLRGKVVGRRSFPVRR